MRFAVATIILLLFVMWPSPVVCDSIDDTDEVVSLYARGKRLLRQGDWFQAGQIFEELLGRFPESKNADLFLFNRSKADYYFGDLDRALAGFGRFANRYAGSPLYAHARFFTGNIQYQKDQVGKALESYIEAFAVSNDDLLTGLVSESIVSMLESAQSVNIAPSDFDQIPKDRKCRLFRSISRTLIQKDQADIANWLLQECGEMVDPGPNAGRATGSSRRASNLEVAMVLPFSGELQSFSDEIYNGAVIASEFYREETGRTMTLAPYDTKGDPVTAALIMRELSASSVDAAVGPLTSDEAQVVSAIIGCEDLPVITPAATQSGLTRLNNTSFQLSPNIELQAVQMADYAVMNLRADSAIIVTSTSTDHLTMSRAFADRFGKLGGTIVAVEYYRARDTDFGPYIKDIKRTLLDVTTDSSFYITPQGDTLDVDALPVSIDVLYLPGNASQLRLMLPQLQFYNIQAAYLGSDGWNDDALYRLGDNITQFALFPSPFIQLSQSDEYIKFAAAYNSRYGKPPQRLAALGYDAVRVIALAGQQGASGREELVARLKELRQFDGAAARVTFGRHRENIEMPIYRIEGGLPVPIGVAGSEAEVQPEQ